MGSDVALTPGDRQLVDPFAPVRGQGMHWRERSERTLDLASMVRILNEYRWLIVGAAGIGLVLALLATLMTTPLYRAVSLWRATAFRRNSR